MSGFERSLTRGALSLVGTAAGATLGPAGAIAGGLLGRSVANRAIAQQQERDDINSGWGFGKGGFGGYSQAEMDVAAAQSDASGAADNPEVFGGDADTAGGWGGYSEAEMNAAAAQSDFSDAADNPEDLGSEADGDVGNKVLCTELHRQGKLPTHIYHADVRSGRLMPVEAMRGYHLWAVPLARAMRRSPVVTKVLAPFIRAWAYRMAYRMGFTKKNNRLGAVLEFVGIPICYVIGSLSRKAVTA